MLDYWVPTMLKDMSDFAWMGVGTRNKFDF